MQVKKATEEGNCHANGASELIGFTGEQLVSVVTRLMLSPSPFKITSRRFSLLTMIINIRSAIM